MQLWLPLCALVAVQGGRRLEGAGRRYEDDKAAVVLSSGVRISVDPKTASGALISKWARELEKNGGTVTHSDAVNRERLIVDQVQSGKLPPVAYREYQLFAAGTGNVDSALLLLSFGVGASVAHLHASRHKLHVAARSCDVPAFRRLLDS